MKYAIILEKSKTGFGAYAPDLPGCVATGATREETLREMETAIAFHLEGMRAEGVAIPAPEAEVAFVTA